MAMLRIRTGGAELEVPDYAALHSMQAGGLIGPDAEIETDEGWKPIAPAPPSAATGDDPWAAWNDVDERKAEQIYETYVHKDEAPAASAKRGVTPARPAPIVEGAPGVPAKSDAPPETALRDDDAAELPVASVSPMPRPVISSRPKAAKGTEPARVPELRLEVPPSPPAKWESAPAAPPPLPRFSPEAPNLARTVPFEPPTANRQPAKPAAANSDGPLLRPGRILGYVLMGLLVVGGAAAALEMSTSVEPPGMSIGAKPTVPAQPDELGDPLAEVERELRSIGLGDVHEVKRDGDLGDGILIDLQKLRLDVERVDAPVLRWVGRKQEDPEQAEVHVAFRSAGELDRELGAIALVVGRYKLRYSIDIPIVEALFNVNGEPRSQMLDDKTAEQFYANRTTLKVVLGLKE